MPPSNKQKKIEKKKAKAKAKLKKANLSKNLNPAARLINSSLEYPIYECVLNIVEIGSGMLNLLVTKKTRTGDLVLAAFLVDTFCLGVKDCFIRLTSIEQYNRDKAKRSLQDRKPEDAKKLLIDVVKWSRQIGIQPHKEYKTAIKIFDGINEANSDAKFEFGKDGGPLFIPGPNDSPIKCRQIQNLLG